MEKRIKKQLRDLLVATTDYIKYHTGETYREQAEAAGIEYEDLKNARKTPPRVTPSRAWIDALLEQYNYTEEQVMEGIAPATKERRDLRKENEELEKEIQELKARTTQLEKEKAQALRLLETALGK